MTGDRLLHPTVSDVGLAIPAASLPKMCPFRREAGRWRSGGRGLLVERWTRQSLNLRLDAKGGQNAGSAQGVRDVGGVDVL